MERWQLVWRHGVGPELTAEELAPLRRALACDSPLVIQRDTAQPHPDAGPHVAPHRCCPLGYAGWRGAGMATVGDVDGWLAELILAADARLEDAYRTGRLAWQLRTDPDLLGWICRAPREEMRRGLLSEIDGELTRRAAQPPPG